MSDWADEECGGAELGDARLTRRLVRLTRSLADQPERSVPQACGDWWETKAAYRLWSHADLTVAQILSGHVQRTVERISRETCVLVVQDTSQLCYTTHRATHGLGGLRRRGQRGMFVHPLLALSTDGLPLGLLNLAFWTWPQAKSPDSAWQRSRKLTSEKVTQCWLDGLDQAVDQIPAQVHAVLISDRESDLFALFANPRPAHVDLLVRCRERRRRVEHPQRLAELAIQHSCPLGETVVEVSRRDGQHARQAKLIVHGVSLLTHPPANPPKGSVWPPIRLQWIWAYEPSPPPGQKALEWLLVTTLPIEGLTDAVRVLQWYSLRWRIERWFYVLKQGCRVEQLALETAARLQLAIATYAIAAWRVLWLTLAAQKRPTLSCETALSADEWQALDCYVHRTATPRRVPFTVGEAVRLLGQLGGRRQSAQTKPPGVNTLWTALERLHDITAMYVRLTRPPPNFMGNA